MYEHHSEPLLPIRQFVYRFLRHALLALAVIAVALGIGMAGYHRFEGLSWLDSFLNASMILTGMGPVDYLNTNAGKLFSAFYALFSGISFLTFVAVLFAPVYHRFLHKLHMDIDNKGVD